MVGNKVMALPDAIARFVRDGCHLTLGGFAITRNVTAAAHEIIRQGRRDLEVSQVIGGLDLDLLVGAGCVRRVRYSGGSLDRFGPLRALNMAADAGRLAVEEYSSLAILLRFHAGALRLPYIGCRSMLGSDMLPGVLECGAARIVEDPFNGGPALMLAPLNPDVAILHADLADPAGNASLRGPRWFIREAAFASRNVVVLCEELVDEGQLDPDLVALPGMIVDAVVCLPRAAHPTAVYGRYDYDREHLSLYSRLCERGLEGVQSYLEKYVYGVSDFSGYLQLVEGEAQR